MYCQIQLDNYNGTYHPGKSIKGRVVCTFDADADVKAVTVKLLGDERTEWNDKEDYFDSAEQKKKIDSVCYSGYNNFLTFQHNLPIKDTFNVGRHEYSFSFVLPKELPGSYQNEYGYIRYYIKAEVYTTTDSDCEDEREIDIMSPIELASLPQDAVRLEDKEDITPHCCINGGSVTMQLELKNKTFVQTQTSRMKVHTYNSSDVKIEAIKVKLKMFIETKATHPKTKRKTNEELIAYDFIQNIGGKGERTFDFELDIPSTTVIPNFKLCSLFICWCVLHVEAVLGRCQNNLEIREEVKLGHFPIEREMRRHNLLFKKRTLRLLPTKNLPTPGLPLSSISAISPQDTFESVRPLHQKQATLMSGPSIGWQRSASIDESPISMEMEPLLPERKKETIEAVVLASMGFPISTAANQNQNDENVAPTEKLLNGK
ncbi:unnamed protein product [Acanthoscelides obtectus]|uniref:Arrestin C-terminal-like domain-containing protein n=2 Tax=Acanthoscelides obtectus TaxID=200917 RepID=A0A9P0PIM8_ACAOB|nr:unnamed protein product [Acanthoscelides obtectus]CAK1677509.1 Arrestin domain-containing protein 5 [Acanthoscelides obtectus]